MDDAAHEHYTVLERKEVSARDVHAALRLEGEEELGRSTTGLWWSSVSCGITLGLSLIAQGVLRNHLPDTSWRPLVASLGYAAGFIGLELGRQELYTGNTLTAVLPALHDRRIDKLPDVLRVFAVVFIGNIAGAWLFAWAAASSGAFAEPLTRTFNELGLEQVRYDFWTAFAKGIFGGWMIALMIWLMPGAHHARIWVIGLITWCLAATEMTHIIAGSVDVLFAVASRQVAPSTYLVKFVAPVFLGNTIGGLFFVAALNHAQVAADDAAEVEAPRLVVQPGSRSS
jgi:formate/nitrite transporter FocA (FNT family)